MPVKRDFFSLSHKEGRAIMVFSMLNTLQGLDGTFLHSKPIIFLIKKLTLEVSRDIVERQILSKYHRKELWKTEKIRRIKIIKFKTNLHSAINWSFYINSAWGWSTLASTRKIWVPGRGSVQCWILLWIKRTWFCRTGNLAFSRTWN